MSEKKFFDSSLSNQSSKILTLMRCICVITVVLMHSNVSHLVSYDNSKICDGFIRLVASYTTINILFILSGYFFFSKDKTLNLSSYKKKLYKRVKTLVIPYCLWCIFGFIFNTIIGQQYSVDIVETIQQIFWGDPIVEGHPAGRAMWYIRNLIVFAILSPIYYIVVRLFKHLSLVIVAITSFAFVGPTYDFPFFNPYLLFGVYCAMYNFSFDKICSLIPMKYISLLVAVVSILNTITDIFYKPDIFTTLIFFIFLYIILGKITLHKMFVVSCTFLYMSHMYLTSVLRNVFVKVFPDNIIFNLLAIVMTWVLSIVLCVTVYYILKKYANNFLQILTGGRA